MDTNLYAPPAAKVADIPEAPAADEAAVRFYPVSLAKLATLHFCTLGMYQIYWFYQHWRRIGRRSGEPMKPVWRSVFSVFYAYPLFKRIRNDAADQPSPIGLAAGPLAAVWIILSLLARLPPPLWLISLLSVLPLLAAQNVANQVNNVAAPLHNPNSRFTAWNWVVVAVGGTLLLLAIVGSFLPDEV